MHRIATARTRPYNIAPRSPRKLSSLWGLCLALLAACSPALPARYVIEQDVGSYQYRRYQQLLDVELPIEGNEAVAHAATYVHTGETIELIPVVVTTYARSDELAETLRQRLRSIDGYELRTVREAGAYVWQFIGHEGDAWRLWVSGPHFIKIGAAEGQSAPPASLVAAYLKLYPSAVSDKGARPVEPGER